MDGAVDWRQLHEFADVDLTRSFVLSWNVEGETLHVEVDVFLTPEHPFYERPRPAEKYCIRPATIDFPICDELAIEGRGAGELIDIVANIEHGGISGFRRLRDGRYEISGEFGTVLISAERPVLRLKGH